MGKNGSSADQKANKLLVKAKKKEKQAEKAASKKRRKMDIDESEDISDILNKIRTQNDKIPSSGAPSASTCSRPSPRAHASLTYLPNGELLMFGGEYFDGQKSIVYNDLYKFNIDKLEWKIINTTVKPLPRCSHQCIFL